MVKLIYRIYSAGQQSIMKMPMNLLDRLNGIYSAKSEVPTNWLGATLCDTLDLSVFGAAVAS